jgi:hypothetical protein
LDAWFHDYWWLAFPLAGLVAAAFELIREPGSK